MKFFHLVTITSLFTSTFLSGEMQTKQLTEEIKIHYADLEQKGDDSKFEVTLKDPHFYWMDTTGDKPRMIGEIDHKGTLKFWVDIPSNVAKAESEGSTHLIFNQTGPANGPIEMTLHGKMTDLIEGDFSKIKEPIAKLRAGAFSEEDILTLLENVKKASLNGRNVKITLAQAAKEMLLEVANINYQHNSGLTPEEFTISLKASAENKSNLFLEADKRDSTISGKMTLSPWRKLAAFLRHPDWKTIPEGNSEWNITSTSEIDSSLAKIRFSSSQGDNPIIEFEINQKVDLVSDWVNKLVANVKKNPPQENENAENQAEIAIYKWLISPQTLPFLNLIPLQSAFDFNGSFEYSAVPAFAAKKGALSFSLLGQKQSGVQIAFNADEQGRNGDLQLLLAGGRPLFNRLISFYNALENSISSVFSGGYMGMQPISQEYKEKLYKLLLSYTADPSAAEKQMKFVVKYNKDEVTIGGKTLQQFMADADALMNSNPNEGSIEQELIEVQ